MQTREEVDGELVKKGKELHLIACVVGRMWLSSLYRAGRLAQNNRPYALFHVAISELELHNKSGHTMQC